MDPLFKVLALLLSLVASPRGDDCPSGRWNAMCRPCCEYDLIQCRCPSKGSRVGYTVPCCRNAVGQCDPCIVPPGCSLFENCKTCNNGTWRANDDFFVDGKYCTECRQGWSGGDCRTCGGVIRRAQGHVALEGYPTNARCEWTLQVGSGSGVELRFSLLSLESHHSCRHDYVEVRDGDDSRSPVIGRFCGDEPPPPIRSSGNALHVLFSSDGYNNLDGFVFTFQESSVSSVAASACPLPETPANGYSEPVYGPEEELLLVSYWCRPPFVLRGAQQRSCLPNGTWSGAVPSCAKGTFWGDSDVHPPQKLPEVLSSASGSAARCPPPPKLLHGSHRAAAEAGGGAAAAVQFFCKNSYVLRGNRRSTCLSNGSWSGRPPTCERACREPKVSELVRQSVAEPRLFSRFSVQDVLSAGFLPLSPDKETRDDGEGEAFPPGFHPLLTTIEYTCASPLYRHAGSSRRTCLKSGKWSGRHVSCSPVCGKLDAFSRHALSDTRWPWLVAIYIRSAPGGAGAASSSGSRRRAGGGQQGASEDAWRLACSGALLAPRSVLAAARCVVHEDEQRPFRPAHVKVVVGMRRRESGGRTESLQQLRVSDVLVHPNFYPGSDCDLAVLRLKDKAKISARTLPVCLPAVQGGEVTAPEAFAATWAVDPRRPYAASAETRPVELSDAARCERALAEGGARRVVLSDNTLCGVSAGSPRPAAVVPGIAAATASFEGVPRGAAGAAWQLLGLESFVLASGEQKTYAVHTKVANFRDWIEENMR